MLQDGGFQVTKGWTGVDAQLVGEVIANGA